MFVSRQLPQEREKLYRRLQRRVLNTPLHEIEHIIIPNGTRIFVKLEYMQPSGSHFDRVYLRSLKDAERRGIIVPGVTPLIEASTGNAGAAFAWTARELGYTDATVVTHADTPKARVRKIEGYGAKVVFSPAGRYAQGYVNKLRTLLKEDRKTKGGSLGKNPARLYCPTKIDAPATRSLYQLANEAHRQLGEIAGNSKNFHFVIGVVGSGVYVSGVGRRLKRINPSTRVIALEAAGRNVLQQLKDGTVIEELETPELLGTTPAGLPLRLLNIDFGVIDEIMPIAPNDWKKAMQLLHDREQLPVGRTSAAEFAAALQMTSSPA